MKTPKITTENKEFFKKLLTKLDACPGFKKNISELNTVSDIAAYIKANKNSIATALKCTPNPDIYDVMDYLTHHSVSTTNTYRIAELLGIEIKEDEPEVKISLLDSMKLELLNEILSDMTLAEVEEIYYRHKPGMRIIPIPAKKAV